MNSKAIYGSFWLGAGSGFEHVSKIVRNIILTRLLAPELFGIVAIVSAINAAFESFTEIGVKQSIIHHSRGAEDEYLNSAWWLSFIRSIVLYILASAIAPWISAFYNNDGLTPLMRFAFLSIIFNGLLSPRSYAAIKKMNYSKWVYLYHGGGIIGISLTIILSIFMRNIWALVIGITLESFARAVLSFIICPFLPRLSINREDVNSLIKYAKGMLGLPILTFIFMKIDIFVLGKLCTSHELGLYSMSIILAQMPFLLIGSIIDNITTPTISRNQANVNDISIYILNISKAILYLIVPAALFAAFYGSDLLSIIYGDQYRTVGIPFSIMLGAYTIRTISIPIASVYFATGRPQNHRLFTFIRVILLIIIIYPGIYYLGLKGASLAVLISMAAAYIIQVKYASKLISLNLLKYGMLFIYSIGISFFVIVVWYLTFNDINASTLTKIILGIVGCIIAYVFTAIFYFRDKIKAIVLNY